VAEQIDRRLVALAQRGISDTEAAPWCKTQDADLPLMPVAVHVVDRLSDVGEAVDTGQRRMDPALHDEAVRQPCLAVVREVRPEDHR
jgi:hypothetical protein